MGTRAETSRKEKAILKFIEDQVKENGYPPSVREIGKAIGLSSTATVHAYLEKLEKQGFIKKQDKKGRTLKVVKGSNGQPITKQNKEFYTQRELVDVPIIGKITAGQPILAVENVTDTFPIPIDFVGNSESFMLTVRGESMIEAGILDGDYILVKKQNDARNGEIVVALIGDEATVKTFYKEKGYIRLQPENHTMELDLLEENGIPVEQLPGIPSFIAAEAAAKLHLISQKERLVIIPGNITSDELDMYLG